ncbi:hypothetical protein BT63DRAFT_464917 [Microthyrium microscopicum]|uniref:Uncharacterized protein n=1 Tax=Microthyrium microscopicum TaxID=703497 RepID=A0A6A6TWC8_9PEZI|nr:hypothetical protein BT63DRAFT_464917 [Microthyrium microscopicum]
MRFLILSIFTSLTFALPQRPVASSAALPRTSTATASGSFATAYGSSSSNGTAKANTADGFSASLRGGKGAVEAPQRITVCWLGNHSVMPQFYVVVMEFEHRLKATRSTTLS